MGMGNREASNCSEGEWLGGKGLSRFDQRAWCAVAAGGGRPLPCRRCGSSRGRECTGSSGCWERGIVCATSKLSCGSW